MGLTKIAITRPIFIFMLMVAAIMLGLISYNGMRVEQNPEVQFGVVAVTTVYPGAGPEEINTLVSRKVEEAIAGVNGLLTVTSNSQEGVSNVVAQFEVGTDMTEALNDVRAKVDGVVGSLPTGVVKPTINKFDSAGDPVLTLVVKSDKLDNQQLRDLADDRLKDRFARINGVAQVDVSGGDVREIQVQVKPDRLIAYGMGMSDALNAISNATMNVPSGRLQSGGKEYAVRVLGEFKTVDEIQNMVLSISDPTKFGARPTIVRLKDIATVKDTTEERRQYARLNGSDAVVLSIRKAREGNAVEIEKGAREVITQLEKTYGIQMVITYNQAKQISESLFDLNFTLFFGIFLVTLIVFLFLHNMRGTIIVGIAIPICIFGAFILLKLFGFTINNMTMLALSLAIGVLVDDAIVVLENIYRHLRMGEDPRTAAINGRAEIGLAAIAITMADVVVFLPIATMGGVVGQFFKPLALGFVMCVLLSLFVSFTVTPMLASRWYRKGEDMEHPHGRFAVGFERMFSRFENTYRRALEWSLRRRWFIFISGFVILVAVFMFIGGSFAPTRDAAIQTGMGPFKFALVIGVVVFIVNLFRRIVKPQFILFAAMFGAVFVVASMGGQMYATWKKEAVFKFAFMPPSDGAKVQVNIELPPGASLDETKAVVERVEQVVMKNPEVEYTLSTLGARGGGFNSSDQGSNYAQISASLHEKQSLLDQIAFWKKHDGKLRTRPDTEVASELFQQVGRIPGAYITVSASAGMGFGAPIQMSFAGEDRDLLVRTVNDIKNRLAQGAIAGVVSPEVSSKSGKPEIRAIPDRIRLADAGVSTGEIAQALRVMYEGNKDTKYRVQGREYNIRVMMDIKDRNNPDIISQLPITFRQNKPIYLGDVADIAPGVGVDKIDRRNREEEVRLTADLLTGYAAGSVQREIDQWLAKEKLIPEGVKIKPLGQADVQNREMGYLFSALVIGVVLVYMLLASLYDNLLYPFIIQLAQPQAMVGALLALIITDKTLNIVGMVGIIALVGLVGKNAILLVDYTNTLRSRGRNRHDALVESGPTRLRPIMMTTLAVILGMLPVALAIGRGSEFRETIGITIIGGITLSTMLTLLVIPCSYTIFDDLSIALGRLIHRRRPQVATAAAGSESEGSEVHLP